MRCPNCQTLAMDFKDWFSKLADDTKLWLIQNRGGRVRLRSVL